MFNYLKSQGLQSSFTGRRSLPVAFTIAEAITRIGNLEEPLWTPGSSSAQQLQSINQALDYLWLWGDFEGLVQDVPNLTSSGGIITLPAQYRFLVDLSIPAINCKVGIKTQQWKLSPSAPRVADWTCWYRSILAFDLGDAVTGDTSQRQYQVTGQPTFADAQTFFGQAKLRYIYATTTATTVLPDCFAALLEAVRAYHWIATGDKNAADASFAEALQILEANSVDVTATEDFGSMSFDPTTSGGSLLNIL
jgi:hypothetical protein